MKRTASAVWKGGLKDGKGSISTESGVLSDTPIFLLDSLRGRQRNESRGVDRGGSCWMFQHGTVGSVGYGEPDG